MQKTVLFISVLVVIVTLPMTTVLALATLIALATVVVMNGKSLKTVCLMKNAHSGVFKTRA